MAELSKLGRAKRLSMNVLDTAGGALIRTADATTALAGAVGGAAANGVVGGVRGTAAGVRDGLTNGSHSTPAAALTLVAIGVAGLVEWPVVLGIGGAALLLHQLGRRNKAEEPLPAVTRSLARKASAPARKSPRKST
jgi:hypothetical protein